MTPERWAQIEELFHRAAECAPEHRNGLLNEACGQDSELRREVEALLSCDGNAGGSVQAAVLGGLDNVVFPLTGETISHYRILDGLGGGGMGLVYRAEDIKLGRRVALKFLPEESVKDPAALGRFEREARSASSLEHPNICPIYEFGEHEGQPFLVMQLLEGQTLRELIATAGPGKPPLKLSKLLDLAVQIVDGLDAAHQKGIIHRDIKPANIFITREGQAKILDFGLAKLASILSAEGDDPERSPSEDGSAVGTARGTVPLSTPDRVLSRTGVAMGTAGYMSPEQVRGEKLDARTDLFSFGLVLYEMATGKRTFAGDTGPELQEAILTQMPSPARKANPEVPAKLEEIIGKALEKDRERRFQSAAEIRSELMRVNESSWHNAAVASFSRLRQRPWNWILGVAAVVALLTAGTFFYMRKAHTLSEKDTIVLADFANSTGDAVFDGTLRRGLAIQLAQSPFLNIVSDEKLSETLHFMGQPPDARLAPAIARDLCQRTGSKAYLSGSIGSLGTQYVLGLSAVNCLTGDALAQELVTADSKERVLKVLGEAAAKMRAKLGESLSTVQKLDTPLEEATTSSLEALQAYSLGVKTAHQMGANVAAVPFYQRAIRLDPNFAMAYGALAASYYNLGEASLAAENTKKAYDLRDRVSEQEKLDIEGHYYLLVTGDLEEARQVYELWTQIYPRNTTPPSNLAAIYRNLGQYDKVLAEMRESVRLDPADGQSYSNFVDSFSTLNRLEEARAKAEEAKTKNLDSPGLRFALYQLAFLRNDGPGMAEQLAWAAGKPGVEDFLLYSEADTAAYSGQLGKARELSRRAVASAERAKENETAAGFEAGAAMREVLVGNLSEARHRAIAALELSTGRDVQDGAALALAKAGDVARAQVLADDLAKRFPEDTTVQFNYLPTLRAQLALSRNDPAKAIDVLKAAVPYELGTPGNGEFSPALYPVYVRGEAYLAAHKGNEAAGEFQKILDHHGVVQNGPIGALAHLGIARAYVMQGETVKGRAAYQDFLTLWKDADPDVPFLIAAKAEHPKLQ